MEVTINENPSVFDLKSVLIKAGYNCSSPLFNDKIILVKKGTVAVTIKPKNGVFQVKGGANTANLIVALPAGIGATFGGAIGALIGCGVGFVFAYALSDKDALVEEVIDVLKEHYTINY